MVLFGVGKVEVLGRELSRRGAKRTLIVTGKTLGQSKLLDQVQECGGQCAGGSIHRRGAACAVANGDGAGGGGAARRRRCDGEFRRRQSDRHGEERGVAVDGRPRRLAHDRFRRRGYDVWQRRRDSAYRDTDHVVGGRVHAGGGVTDESTKVKGVVADPRLQARAVILDPALTVETPAWLWASTGMRALDHAVEGSYSTRHQLVTDTLASKAIALLNAHLLPSLQTHGDDELEHRVQCQLAAWLSIFGMSSNSRGGISHALGHQIGPMWNVPHGITSCITLPHVMRLMAGVAADRFAPIAQGFEVRFDPQSPRSSAMECVDRTARFIGKFDVPTRLRDVSVPREEISRIAGTVLEEVKHANTVGVEVTLEQLVGILDAAY